MKRVVQHPSESPTGPRYWRSLDELSQAPGFQSWMQREFPDGASSLEGVDRRHFMKIMAAGFAFAGVGMAGCRRPEAYIKTYAKQPEQIIPGQPTFYASSFPLRQDAIPLVVETHGARPTKLEGNPSFPAYRGSTDLRTQASILDLYDPDRAQQHTGARGERLNTAQVNDLLQAVHAAHAATSGEGLAFLAESSSSPTRLRLVRALRKQFPKLLWAEYDATDLRNGERAATALAGRPARPVLKLSKAKRIVSLDSDFLFSEPGNLANAKGFADGRRIVSPEDAPGMNRLYAIESNLTVSGSNADHRLRAASGEIPALAAALAVKVFAKTGATGPVVEAARSAVSGLNLDKTEAWLEACAEDLVAHKGASVIITGSHLPVETHALALVLNQALDALGHTLDIVSVDADETADLPALAKAIQAGSVKTLVILGGNPAYDAPADLDWSALQGKVPQVIRHGYYHDETCEVAGTIHIGATHYLESWGDARTWDGTVVPVQPMILPLFPVMQENELLARLAGVDAPDAYQIVFDTFRTLSTAGDAAAAMAEFLHDGLLQGTAWPAANRSLNAQTAARLVRAGSYSAGGYSGQSLEVRFVPDSRVDDGRSANNGWLQECPDPITKLSWDNAIIISPRLAKELDILPEGSANQITAKTANTFVRGRQTAPIGRLSVDGRSIEGPVHIQPGLANYTVVLPLGFGRSVVGRVGTGAGFNASKLRSTAAPHFASGAKLTIIGSTVTLANQQEHWSYEGRDIFREGNAAYYADKPSFVKDMGIESHAPPNLWNEKDTEEMPLFRKSAISTPRGTGLYETPDFTGTHQWGMSIDLNTCTGCNACVVACQARTTFRSSARTR
jgi:MoCo/4Fe-4S cofactor protein with predicted Tat translocation signal